ncbi:peptidylprolyl isomerase [Coprinopsis sp. MPI-PUGE-AT-0042]|nr:peptidylprolyl isomerase [Coprinopsis sp. MPI-PUGE-AT-0042]
MAEIELWSHRLEGGAEEEISLPGDVRLTNIAFGEELPDENGRSVIKLAYEDILSAGDESDDDEDEEKKAKEEKDDEDDDDLGDVVVTVITALTAGRTEQSTVNVVLKGERPYVLINTGKNPVYLTGNYIEHADEPPYDSGDEEFGSDEDGYDLREVSSDVEMDPHDLDGLDGDETDASRFEEIVEAATAKATKRPRDTEDTEEAPKKKEKKNKKQKGEDGKPVPAEAASGEKDKKEKKEKKEKKDTEAVKTLAGGLKVQDTKVGTGPEAKKGSRVGVRYIGKLENGKIFDKNVKGKPFQFKLGKGDVIKGWDEGFAGMRVGGERVITVPPALGYGKKGAGNDIPPNATLRFEVKLLEVA